jgi:hypothetical protein
MTKVLGEKPDFSKESIRINTYSRWPTHAPLSAKKLARAGFYYMGNSLFVKCFSCNVVYGDWKFVDDAFTKHREISKACEFLKKIYGPQQTDTESDDFLMQMKIEKNRLDTYVNWPHKNLPPSHMAKAGFFFLHQSDKTKCAFCSGLIYNWNETYIPLCEHVKHFPKCPFILTKGKDECGWQKSLSFSENKSSLAMQVSIKTRGVVESQKDLQDFGVYSEDTPKHANMLSVNKRFKTFEDWPKSHVLQAESLADAGFLHTYERRYQMLSLQRCALQLGRI